jgi:hypothetical protein
MPCATSMKCWHKRADEFDSYGTTALRYLQAYKRRGCVELGSNRRDRFRSVTEFDHAGKRVSAEWLTSELTTAAARTSAEFSGQGVKKEHT